MARIVRQKPQRAESDPVVTQPGPAHHHPHPHSLPDHDIDTDTDIDIHRHETANGEPPGEPLRPDSLARPDEKQPLQLSPRIHQPDNPDPDARLAQNSQITHPTPPDAGHPPQFSPSLSPDGPDINHRTSAEHARPLLSPAPPPPAARRGRRPKNPSLRAKLAAVRPDDAAGFDVLGKLAAASTALHAPPPASPEPAGPSADPPGHPARPPSPDHTPDHTPAPAMKASRRRTARLDAAAGNADSSEPDGSDSSESSVAPRRRSLPARRSSSSSNRRMPPRAASRRRLSAPSESTATTTTAAHVALDLAEFDKGAVELACRLAGEDGRDDVALILRTIGLNQDQDPEFASIMDTARQFKPFSKTQRRVIKRVAIQSGYSFGKSQARLETAAHGHRCRHSASAKTRTASFSSLSTALPPHHTDADKQTTRPKRARRSTAIQSTSPTTSIPAVAVEPAREPEPAPKSRTGRTIFISSHSKRPATSPAAPEVPAQPAASTRPRRSARRSMLAESSPNVAPTPAPRRSKRARLSLLTRDENTENSHPETEADTPALSPLLPPKQERASSSRAHNPAAAYPHQDEPIPTTETADRSHSSELSSPAPLSDAPNGDDGEAALHALLHPSPAGRRPREPQHKRLTPPPRPRKEQPRATRRAPARGRSRAEPEPEPEPIDDGELARMRQELTKSDFPGYSVAESKIRPSLPENTSEPEPAGATGGSDNAARSSPAPDHRHGRGTKRRTDGQTVASSAASSRLPSPSAKRARTNGYLADSAEVDGIRKRPLRLSSRVVPSAEPPKPSLTCRLCDGKSANLLECAHCGAAFHPECLDSPLAESRPDWCCPDCQSEPPESPPLPAHNIFQELVKEVDYLEPELFMLPEEIATYFADVEPKPDGSYQDRSTAIPIRNRTGYNIQTTDYFRLRDSRHQTIHCVHCSRTALSGRPIVACDDCGQYWHLDCVDPPMANVPADFSNGKFRYRFVCPRHVSTDIAEISNDFGLNFFRRQHLERRFHRHRKVANPKYVDLRLRPDLAPVGTNIEFVDRPSDDEFYSDHVDEDGEMVTYRMPTRGVKLDFLSRFKRDPRLIKDKTELHRGNEVAESQVPSLISGGVALLESISRRLCRPLTEAAKPNPLDVLVQAALKVSEASDAPMSTPTPTPQLEAETVASKAKEEEGESTEKGQSGEEPREAEEKGYLVSPLSPPPSENVGAPATARSAAVLPTAVISGDEMAALERLRDAIDHLILKGRDSESAV